MQSNALHDLEAAAHQQHSLSALPCSEHARASRPSPPLNRESKSGTKRITGDRKHKTSIAPIRLSCTRRTFVLFELRQIITQGIACATQIIFTPSLPPTIIAAHAPARKCNLIPHRANGGTIGRTPGSARISPIYTLSSALNPHQYSRRRASHNLTKFHVGGTTAFDRRCGIYRHLPILAKEAVSLAQKTECMDNCRARGNSLHSTMGLLQIPSAI